MKRTIMVKWKYLFSLSLVFFLGGCSIIKESDESFKFKYIHSTNITNFTSLTENLLDQLCPEIQSLSQKHHDKPFYVVDFVNIKDLQNHSQLGFMLSDELKTHVTQNCKRAVYSIEHAKYLKIGENGTEILTRDIDELHQTKINKNTYALVGTYAITQRQLLLYLKLVDLQTGVIIKAASEKTLITDEVLYLEKQPSKINSNPNYIYTPMRL